MPARSIHYIDLPHSGKVAYSDVGRGKGKETLLFIHGLGTYGESWQKNIAMLKEHYRCIAIDLPGYGHSATGDYPFTMQFFAHCIIDLIGQMDLKQVTLVGHSMGGQIALTAALAMPQCCERLVLCAPAGFEQFSPHERLLYESSLRYLSMVTTNEQAIHHLIHTGFHRFPKDGALLEKRLLALLKKQSSMQYKKMTEQCVTAMFAEPVFARLHQIEHECLILFGELDALIPNTLFHPTTTRRIAEAGHRELRNSSLKMIPSCGHFLQWEHAEETNSEIYTWLRQTSQADC